MKSINATLLAAQKTGAGQAIARASLADNGKMHFAAGTSMPPGGDVCDAVNTGSEFIRIRYVAATAALHVQRITNPATAAQWTTWTNLDIANVYSAIAIFWTGTYAVIVWQNSATKVIHYKRSSDGGVTWSATATAYAALATFCSMAGVSGGAARSGIMLTYSQQLYWGAYDPAADTWTAVNSAAITMTSVSPSVAAAWDADNSRHIIAFAPNGYVTWASAPVILLIRSTAGAWRSDRVYYGGITGAADQANLTLSQGKINGYWYLAFTRVKGWGTENYWLTCSDDGLAFQDLIALDLAGLAKFVVLGALTGSTTYYAANEAKRFSSTPNDYWTNQPLRTYQIQHQPSRPASLYAEINSLQVPADLYTILTLERGYNIAGTDYYVSAGTFYIIASEVILADKILCMYTVDAIGLLDSWIPDQTFRFDNENLKTIIELICALAGVHAVSFDAHAIWTDVVALFTVNPPPILPGNQSPSHIAPTLPLYRQGPSPPPSLPPVPQLDIATAFLDISPGQTGLAVIRSLQQRAPFEMVPQADGSIYFFIPAAAPASTYTYGQSSGNHVHWPGAFGLLHTPDYEVVFGQPAETIADEASNFSAQASAGRRTTRIANERRITTVADATQLAAARLLLDKENIYRATFNAPPNFGLEPMDVITITSDIASWASSYLWRVTGFTEQYNSPGPRKFYQSLTLRGVVE